MKVFLILISIIFGCLNVIGQSKVSMFQIIQKPIETISTDSINWMDSTLNLSEELDVFFGDSIELSGIIVMFDTNQTHSIHFKLESDSAVLIEDSVYFQNISILETENLVVHRKGRVLYLDWGNFIKPENLQGECYIKNNQGEVGEIKYFDNQ